MASTSLPKTPEKLKDLAFYLSKHPEKPLVELLQPYKLHEIKLRELFAQGPSNAALNDPHVNAVPVFNEHTAELKIRARDLTIEDEQLKEKYIMPLTAAARKPNGSPAVVRSLKEFRDNFNLFSELSLSDLDWNNVVAAGSSVLTPLLPVPKEYSGSKKALRQYYHEKLAPASDVDLFLWGLSEEEAIEKIKQIETKIRDSILHDCTTIRTKHTITIASQYPTRHVQIVLRIYKSVSEILTGFDVDCSCVAYDGEQVYASPRAIGALMSQTNQVDLSRRSPSYESRLSKYSHRGFEVHWAQLDRSKVDPTIFERSFARTLGLARLLILEKLPKEENRTDYANQRRTERGRPAKLKDSRRKLWGNIKDGHEDEVAEWVQHEDAVANYHSFTIPYGEKFNAKRIEKLLYTKDLLLNAEWNVKDREVKLHRHPAFFGDAEDVIRDCCGFCPQPTTPEELKLAEEESKIYVSGDVKFLIDDPGRQTIGSFNPIAETDWTEMAYVGNTARLCEAIVNSDLEAVQSCLTMNGIDPNRRDYTGRTPLHLAVMCSSAEVVKCLLNSGAYLVWRLADGRSAMHLAATRGDVEIIRLLIHKNEENKSEAGKLAELDSQSNDDSDEELLELSDLESSPGSEISGSLDASAFIKVETCKKNFPSGVGSGDNAENRKLKPKDDILDANVAAWDSGCTPHHLAIAFGHNQSLKVLINEFGSNPSCAIKLVNGYSRDASGALLGLVLALSLPIDSLKTTAAVLLASGAKCSQADLNGITAFHYYVNRGADMIDFLTKHQNVPARSVVNWVAVIGTIWQPQYATPLRTAIENRDLEAFRRLLDLEAKMEVDFEGFVRGAKMAFKRQLPIDPSQNIDLFKKSVEQPIILAVQHEQPIMVRLMLDKGIDPNTLTANGQRLLVDHYSRSWQSGNTLLDKVREKLAELEEYREIVVNVAPPIPLQEDEHYFQGICSGTYKDWVTCELLQDAKRKFKRGMDAYQKSVEEAEAVEGLAAKKQAIADLISSFRDIEKDLLAKDAKTFSELHPGIVASARPNQHPSRFITNEPKPFVVNYNFHIADLTDAKRDTYLGLFEAAWAGDLSKIKELTTIPQGLNKDQPPLNISISDNFGNTPFAIAIARGHLDVALSILDIAQVQYVPGKQNLSYTMNANNGEYSDSEESVDDDERIRLYSRLPASVRNQFTVDDIGGISTLVKSEVSALQILRQSYEISRFPRSVAAEKEGGRFILRQTVFDYAILINDLDLLSVLLDAGSKYLQSEGADGDVKQAAFSLTSMEFDYAVRSGRVQLLAEIIRRTGSGIPLDQLVQKSGVEATETPKYYTGLSIRGKKRKDWAEAYQNKHTVGPSVHHPPLLQAAHAGNIEAVEWFLSDSPLRLYSEFAEANKDDERLKSLNQTVGGFPKSVESWLHTRSELILHCAIISPWKPGLEKFVSDLVKLLPSALNARNSTGHTPLHFAFSLRRESLAKILLEAGADPKIRDFSKNNLIHTLLVEFGGCFTGEQENVDKLLDLLDPALRREMLLQRNSYSAGARTPVHHWMHRKPWKGRTMVDPKKTLKTILQHSRGEELDMIDGSGDTPVHTAVSSNQKELLGIMLEVKPNSIWRENAVGRIPAEVAQDSWLASKVSSAPNLGTEVYHCTEEWKSPLVKRSAQSFVRDIIIEKTPVDEIWELCKKHMETHQGKRKLVSLNEANEVARRLTEVADKTGRAAFNAQRANWRRARQGDDGADQDAVEEVVDEAVAWYGEANPTLLLARPTRRPIRRPIYAYSS